MRELETVRLILSDRTTLFRELHALHLISSRIFTTWLAETLSLSNLAQVGFVTQLITAHLPDVVRHLISARLCVRAACEKVKEVGEERLQQKLM
jgi:mediator of RNA polymerase II transcription subunit 12